jgi:transposase InsO family protein
MSSKTYSLCYRIKVYNSSMYHLINSKRFNESDTAKLRLQVIEYHTKYGTQPTIDAFKISKASIFRWKKLYLDSNKNIYCLIPQSRKPHTLRTMNTDIKIIEYIKKLREAHPNLGKEKIKPLLDQYVVPPNHKGISVSTIGKILKRYNMISSKKRVYHNPNHKYPGKRKPVQRIKFAPRTDTSGYFQIDTVQMFVDRIRIYVFNAVDIHTKFEFSYTYKQSNTKNSVDFLKKLLSLYPVHTVQTDNGSEYLGEFHRYLVHKRIKHLYIYPRCPRINGCVERANRSLKEEFIYKNECTVLTEGLEGFNKKLMEHLVWFNTLRPHNSLNNLSPIQYMLKYIPKSHMYTTYTFR